MGDGTFAPSDIFSEAETYTPGAADIAAGDVVLRLTSDDPDENVDHSLTMLGLTLDR